MHSGWIRKDRITGHVRPTGHFINRVFVSSPGPFWPHPPTPSPRGEGEKEKAKQTVKSLPLGEGFRERQKKRKRAKTAGIMN
jgi:hypothetical protein